MAGYQLIDAYIHGLRRRLLWCPDVDDLIAEAEDHLVSAMERLKADDADDISIQQAVLGQFGDSTTVATAFAATSTGGLAMPTRFTRRAGVAAIVAAVLWTAFAAMWLIDEIFDLSDRANQITSFGGLFSLIGATALTVVVVVGLNRRHGGLGPLGTIGLILIGFSVVAALLFWFVMGWGLLLAIGMLLVAVAVNARRLAPTAATAAFGVAWLVGVSTWSVLRLMEIGTRDRWGDYPLVSPIAITVGVVILVPGLIGLGLWLSKEVPADVDSPESLARA